MAKKRGKQINIKINLTNRWLYTLIAIGILAIVGVGVYASTYINSATKTGHDLSEIQPCAAGKILQTNSAGNGWDCVDIPSSALPTDCTIGQVLGWDGIAWDCADAGGAPSPYLVYSQHTEEECNIFGEVYSYGTDSFCKISSPECPVGWTQFNNWCTTIPTTFQGVSNCNGCTTGSHSFANIAIESCGWQSLYWTGACLSQTGYADVTEKGCY